MSRYRKIEVRTWSDEAFRELSPLQPSGQGLWLYLLTGPQTGPIPGLYRAGRAAMAEELDWPLDAFYDKFAELESRGMARADWKARLVWLPNALKHNKPESPNVVRSWRTELDLLPECSLKREALVQIRQTLADMGPSYLKAFEEVSGDTQPEALPKALPEALPQSLSESGTGTGTGTGNPAAAGAQLAGPDPAPEAAPAPAAPGQAMHSAGDLSAVMRRHGVKANPGHPDLIALAAQGVSPETVQAACEEARRAKPDEAIGMVYVLGILKRWKADAAKLDLAGVSAPRPAGGAWWASDASILAKGMELGLAPRAGESMPTFKGRIELAIGGQAPPPSPSRVIAPAVIETRGKKPEGLDLKALLRQATARGP